MPKSRKPRKKVAREDRVLVQDGRRHHRPRYSRTEFRLGLGALAVLIGIVGWVAWRGAHPDPSLFDSPPIPESQRTLPERSAAEQPGSEPAGLGAPEPGTPPNNVGSPAGAAAGDSPGDRGPLPDGLAADGWREEKLSTFGYDNLYVKINGREDYYKSLGFQQLWFLSLVQAGGNAFVDLETYDLGETANALGAAAGERPDDAEPTVSDAGLTLLYRNALYLTRGRYYVRAIGSDESAAVVAQLEFLRDRLDAELEGEALPWAYGLFVGQLGFSPGGVSYAAENAFSFGFASDVYSAALEDETELFVVRKGSAKDAEQLAAAFREGFLGYGAAAGVSMGVDWTKDRYIETISGAKAVDRWTVGVRGAPDIASAEAALSRLETAVRQQPETSE
jgi:hypothetical protein